MEQAASNFEHLYHQLNQAYSLKKHPLKITNQQWEIYSVKNIDDLLDALIAKGDSHQDVQDERIPYWADLWPASIALASYILENPALLEKKKVLEIGCGLGLAGMAAATISDQVIMTDYLSDTFPFIQLNWLHNLGKSADCRLLDWRYPDNTLKADVLIAADVIYESRAFEPLVYAFRKLVNPGGIILLSEPGRHMAQEFLQSLPSRGFNVRIHQREIHKDGLNTKVGIYQLSY